MSDQGAAAHPVKGEKAAGGFHTIWPDDFEDAGVSPDIEFQYADMAHQSETALSGMWLFLVTELLFFGSLFLLYAIIRAEHQQAVALASQKAELGIGTINTLILLTSSAIFSYGFTRAQQGRNRPLFWASTLTALLGVAFLLLKGYEWYEDFEKHLFPGPHFAMTGPDSGGAQLFWCFYFIATGLHGLHMIVGVGLVTWIAIAARHARFSTRYVTPVEVVGLYWSFVDMVWLVLYPTIYLAGRLGG